MAKSRILGDLHPLQRVRSKVVEIDRVVTNAYNYRNDRRQAKRLKISER